MSLIKTIYNLPIIDQFIDEDLGIVTVDLKYNGRLYSGYAFCAEEDMPIFSKRVGLTIAKSRARISIMEDELKKLKEEVYWKERMFNEVTKELDTFDLVNSIDNLRFMNNVNKALTRKYVLEQAIAKEKEELKLYLQSHETFLARLTSLRNNQDNIN